MIVPEHQDADVGDVVVQVGSEGGWFRKLDRAVVGRVGLLGEKGLDALVVTNWVLRWWKSSGEVEVFRIGGQFYLFVFSSRREAESVLRRRWTIAGRDMVLSWWSPDSLCADGGAPVSVSNNWVQILGLPIHLRSLELFREIGNRCGGFVAIDESVENLGVFIAVHGERWVSVADFDPMGFTALYAAYLVENWTCGGYYAGVRWSYGYGSAGYGRRDSRAEGVARISEDSSGEAIGLHDMFNGYGLGESSVNRVFDPGLGPSSKEPTGQLTGRVEDLPVARVFELLRRSVGLPSSEGSSLVRKDRRQSLLCSPTLSPGLSQCQPQFNSEKGGDKARPFAEPSQMLVLRSEGYEQEGAGLGCHVDFSTRLEGDL
ncbi:hypothetical protein LOK49_LG05G00041 [Camellia lanceoleosa]|uniref:Uncharacterized protein n=1 Tax=Camellia lanceoleosa TaxID=1840588 RepID=A0ACC0HNJ1_9ERIC|nr:hypothetical protein LOK49_LG05G00041 [Camellia lanceoleosa]